MSERMSYRKHTRALLTLGLPMIGGHLAQLGIGMTDTLMMGRYGVPELAALTIAGSYFFMLFLFGSGFAWAITPMIAASAARDDHVQIRRATRMALWLSGFYFVLVFPLLWFSAPIMLMIGQSGQTAEMAQEYLRIAGFGMLPALGVMVLKNYLAGMEYTRAVLLITLAAVGANIALNHALIFGNWGAPELGIAGAAIASLIVQILSLGLVLVYALRLLPQHALLHNFWHPDWEMFSRVFHLGWPIGAATLAEVGLFTTTAAMMGWLGNVPQAAHGIAMQLAGLTFMVQLGLANAATVRAGNALGRLDSRHMLDGARVVMVACILTIALSVTVFICAPEFLVSLFLSPDEPERDAVLSAGVTLLYMAALFQMVDALQVVHLGLLRGLHDTRVPMVIAAVAYWGIGMPAAYVFGFVLNWEGPGIWLGLTLGLAVAALALVYRFWKYGAGMVEHSDQEKALSH